MTSTFFGLEIAKRGLVAQQAALNVTGNNISNANTTGYTLQRAEMQSTSSIPYPGLNNDVSAGQLGTGVEVDKIARLRDAFLDTQYRTQNMNLGYWQAKSDTYSQIEDAVNEPSTDGIANAMDQFWTGWQELSKNPASSAARAVVRQDGVTLADSFNTLSTSLDTMSSDLDKQISDQVNQINSYATQIRDLNDQISRIVPNGSQPNDLYDKRDLLLDQLSNLVDINVQQSTNGMIQVSVGNPATDLVSDRTTSPLSVSNTGQVSIGGTDVTLSGGDLQGRIESRYTIVPNFKQSLDTMVSTFAQQVNTIHSQGLNLDDISNPSATPDALPFFVGTTAGTIAVNPAIMTSLNKIAAASTPSTGNGDNANAIAQVKYDVLNFNNTASSTTDDYYQNIVGQLGISSQESQRMQDNSQVMLNQVDNNRQSVSGVSLDEEMSNMIRFQQAYNASARLVTTMDQMLDKVINGMGTVGQ